MKNSPVNVLLTFFEDVFLIFLLGAVVGALIYSLAGRVGISNGAWEAIGSIIIALLGVSVFQRGTISVIGNELPRFALYTLVAFIPVLFLLGYWSIGSLLLGFLGGYIEREIGKKCKTNAVHST